MIKTFFAGLYARRVAGRVKRWASRPHETQQKVFSELISASRQTSFGQDHNFEAAKLYVVNAAMAGTGISVTGTISKPDDGLLEVFVLSTKNLETLSAAADRALKLNTKASKKFIKQGKVISIDTDPDQPVWTDGEYTGRTPISMEVVPGALPVVVPSAPEK